MHTTNELETQVCSIHAEWQRRLQSARQAVDHETNPLLKTRLQKAVRLLEHGIDPWPSLEELNASPAYREALVEARLHGWP